MSVSSSKRRAPATTQVRVARPGHSGALCDRACLIVLTGEQRGEVYTVGPEGVILGRGNEADCVLADEEVSRAHAHVFRLGDRFVIVDLASTNGTFVDCEPCGNEPVELRNGARIQLGQGVLFAVRLQCAAEEAVTQQLYETATRDAVTRTYNRNTFDQRLSNDVAKAARQGIALSLILFDIDHFKRINDRWGHLTGDRVLRAVAQSLRQNIRKGDLLARYGGEEFAVISRGASEQAARVIAERCRSYLEAREFIIHEEGVTITLSAGVASLSRGGRGGDVLERRLIRDADAALYEAKRRGRNQVRTVSEMREAPPNDRRGRDGEPGMTGQTHSE